MSGNNEKWQKVKEDNENLMDDAEIISDEKNSETTEPALDHPSHTELEEKLTLAEQKAHENWDKAKRAEAELVNVIRRAENDVKNAHRYGVEKLLNSLFPLMDSLEQALLLAQNAGDAAMQEGLDLTMKLFLDTLAKFDVVQLNPVGEAFDPHQHEAMGMQEAPGVAPNQVTAVFQKGYRLSDRVVRPARVMVSK